MELARVRPRVSEVIGSHPTQKVIVTRSEVEVSPLLLCALGMLDLGKDRYCSSLNFRLVLPSVLQGTDHFLLLWTEEARNWTGEGLFLEACVCDLLIEYPSPKS